MTKPTGPARKGRPSATEKAELARGVRMRRLAEAEALAWAAVEAAAHRAAEAVREVAE